MTHMPDHASASDAVPYGTPDQPRVSVRGEATYEVDPEIARLSVMVTSRGTGRRDTLKALTRRNSEVLELLKGYGEAVEKLSTGSFSVSPVLAEKGRKEKVRSYTGSVYISATVGDFTALGEMTTQLADMEMTRVHGPWWALRPDSPAHGEARRRAVQEAVTRAREYAGALGADLVALVELADIGAESAPPPMARAGRAAATAAYAGASAEAAPALDLEPQRQRLSAQVNARFVISRPEL